MKNNIVKPLLLCAASSLLLGCGSGSSSNNPSTQASQNQGSTTTTTGNQKTGNGFSITEDNYVASASTFLNTALTTALPAAVSQELSLPEIRVAYQASTSRSCSISGDVTTNIAKHPLNETIVHANDSLERIYSDCKDAFSTQSGTRKIEISALEGTYESDEYVIYTDIYENITKSDRQNASDNGGYRYHLPVVYGKTNNKRIEFIGIDISRLNANVVPNINFPNAENKEAEHAIANKVAANPSSYSTPSATFNIFAFELIEDNTTLDQQVKYRWKFDITNKDDADSSYSMQTTQQLILEERYVDESGEEDGDNLETVALQGKFNFKMATGEIIYVEIHSPDAGVTPGTPIPSNVVVKLDIYGDDVIDYQTGMTWEEFTIAMFGFFAP